MPFATGSGARIHYQVTGDGVPIVIHPGFFGTSDDWYDAGYVAALQDAYRLIILDPRGQGRSDAPHDPEAYTVRRRVDDVVAVLDAEGIGRAHFWGYSMGGGVGFAFGVQAPERARSLVLGAGHPFRVPSQPDGVDPMIAALRQGMASVVRDLEATVPDPWVSAGERERWLAADVEALIAARTQRLREAYIAPNDAARIAVPALVYAGTADSSASVEVLEEVARSMPTGRFVGLDGLDHAQVLARVDLVVPMVCDFLASVDGEAASRA